MNDEQVEHVVPKRMKKKELDAVKTMREEREALSKKFNKLTLEEQKRYLRKNLE